MIIFVKSGQLFPMSNHQLLLVHSQECIRVEVSLPIHYVWWYLLLVTHSKINLVNDPMRQICVISLNSKPFYCTLLLSLERIQILKVWHFSKSCETLETFLQQDDKLWLRITISKKTCQGIICANFKIHPIPSRIRWMSPFRIGSVI